MEIEVKIPDGTVEELANRVLDEFEYEGKTIRQWANSLTNPMTNADRIRAMSDEELAEFFHDMIQDCGCNNVPCQQFCKVSHCELAWLNWLKKEARTND